MKMRRQTFERVAVWHESIRAAREISKDGVFSTGQLLSIWGRSAKRIPAPLCVCRRRHERDRRVFAELASKIAALPPPRPPEGRTWAFSNGTEYSCWTGYNCDSCALAGDPNVRGSSPCLIFETIHDAGMDDGTISIEIAERMALPENKGSLYWRCPEFVEA